MISLFGRLPLAFLLVSLPAFADSVRGIRNFDQVDAYVYRGGQPSDEGFRYLARLGVKTVIDLREADERSTVEARVVASNGMRYVNVPMTGLTPPTETEIGRILAILEDTTAGPVFVHCMRGADRTGAVIAAYHVEHDEWTNARALEDAKAHSMGSFQFPRRSFIKNFRPRTAEARGSLPSTATPAPATDASPSPAPVKN